MNIESIKEYEYFLLGVELGYVYGEIEAGCKISNKKINIKIVDDVMRYCKENNLKFSIYINSKDGFATATIEKP